jgi:hypothetical protein
MPSIGFLKIILEKNCHFILEKSKFGISPCTVYIQKNFTPIFVSGPTEQFTKFINSQPKKPSEAFQKSRLSNGAKVLCTDFFSSPLSPEWIRAGLERV